ncbi:MAG TPA: hypothetical protein VLA89_01620 [Gemmatimonadales bacterium]|nr:hypothetical protein [Gemmatimonadales bacterium]
MRKRFNIEVKRGYAVLLDSDRPVAAWLWGWRPYPPQFTAHRQLWGRRGFTVRLRSTLIIVTLPGKGYLR